MQTIVTNRPFVKDPLPLGSTLKQGPKESYWMQKKVQQRTVSCHFSLLISLFCIRKIPVKNK